MTVFTNGGHGKHQVSFAAPYPGKILPMDLETLGGEGLFFATLTGPGRVWLQSLPFSRLAARIRQSMPLTGSRREEGSILGGIGDLLDGDR